MTTEQTPATSQPGEVRSSAKLGLPPLPPLPQRYMLHWINCFPFKSIELFKAEQMQAYAVAAAAAALEAYKEEERRVRASTIPGTSITRRTKGYR